MSDEDDTQSVNTTADTASFDSDAFSNCSSEPSEISISSIKKYMQPDDAISWPCMCTVNCVSITYLEK